MGKIGNSASFCFVLFFFNGKGYLESGSLFVYALAGKHYFSISGFKLEDIPCQKINI